MSASFFFYDLETSGLKPAEARIMQFAGQRTDMNLKPIGEPINILIKLTPDVLPEPDAILLTGITPSQTFETGITEADFLKRFYKEIATPDTIFVGFNNIRFDDEFIRFLNYRNFYDPYAWSWQDNRSRWDILDLVRMTRALRPEGIIWPFKDDKPINRLEELTKANHLSHETAHDALSDVYATIDVARLIKKKQPKLFKYLLDLRSKTAVSRLVENSSQLVYTAKQYPSENLHTTVVMPLMPHPDGDAFLVYDLRHDPASFLEMDPENLVSCWQYSDDPEILHLPVKTIKYNRVPAVAPMSVLDEAAIIRINLSLEDTKLNFNKLHSQKANFNKRLSEALAIMNQHRNDRQLSLAVEADQDLYGGFFNNPDRNLFADIHLSDPEQLDSFLLKLHDKRLKTLLPLYKARNYPASLTPSEAKAWWEFCQSKTNGEKAYRYQERMNVLYGQVTNQKDRALLDELKDYLEQLSVNPKSSEDLEHGGRKV